MGDHYWRYNPASQQPLPPAPAPKRPRADLDVSTGHDIQGFVPSNGRRGVPHGIQNRELQGASHLPYLHTTQMSPFNGTPSASLMSGGIFGRSFENSPKVGCDGLRPMATVAESTEVWKAEIPPRPPPSSTLFVEGLPANCSRREVSHIFRPFVGYKEVRLVTKHSGRAPLVLCFVDFVGPAEAAQAKEALQGYVLDEYDPGSATLKVQFARYPSGKSGGGHRGRH